MTLAKARILTLLMLLCALGSAVLGYFFFDHVTVFLIQVLIFLLLAVAVDIVYDRCPKCKLHINPFKLKGNKCPNCKNTLNLWTDNPRLSSKINEAYEKTGRNEFKNKWGI